MGNTSNRPTPEWIIKVSVIVGVLFILAISFYASNLNKKYEDGQKMYARTASLALGVAHLQTNVSNWYYKIESYSGVTMKVMDDHNQVPSLMEYKGKFSTADGVLVNLWSPDPDHFVISLKWSQNNNGFPVDMCSGLVRDNFLLFDKIGTATHPALFKDIHSTNVDSTSGEAEELCRHHISDIQFTSDAIYKPLVLPQIP